MRRGGFEFSFRVVAVWAGGLHSGGECGVMALVRSILGRHSRQDGNPSIQGLGGSGLDSRLGAVVSGEFKHI